MNNKALLGVAISILLVTGGYQLASHTKPSLETQSPSVRGENTAVSPPVNTGAEKSYTINEIANHSTPSDCWIVIEGKVYNVTDYIRMNPGGAVIVKGCGKDATNLVNNRPGGEEPRPQRARDLLPNFYIGELAK